MSEDDIKGILWLLKEINEDRKMGSYFKQQLNIRNTDIKRLIIKFAGYVKMLNEPMRDKLDLPIFPNIRVNK